MTEAASEPVAEPVRPALTVVDGELLSSRFTPDTAGMAAIADAAAVALAAAEEAAGADELDALAERWLMTLKRTTAAQYEPRLRLWLTFCADHGYQPLSAPPELLTAYTEELRATVDPRVEQARLAAVRSFYRYAVEEGRLNESVAGRPRVVLPATIEDATPGALTVHQLAAGFLLGRSGHTLAAYTRDLKHFLTWCRQLGLDPLALQRAHIDAYRLSLEAAGLAPSSIARKLSTLRGFYLYAVEEGPLERSPAHRVRPPRVPPMSTSTGLERHELVALLDGAEKRGPQHYALVCLLSLCGLRVNEAVGSDIPDLSSICGHRVLQVERKGYAGTKQPVVLAPRTAAAIDAWLEVRPDWVAPELRDLPPTGALFLNRKGKRLARESVWYWLRLLARDVVPAKAATLHPHDLRHAFVTLSLDAGVPLRDVQDSAGHASADTTRRYDRNRNHLDRNATYPLAAYIAAATPAPPAEPEYDG